MKMVQISVELKQEDFKDFGDKINRLSHKIMEYTTQELLRNIKINSPVDTGRLQGSWMVSRGESTNSTTIMSSTKYADYLDKGTGLYGPNHAMVYPKKGKFLVFTPHTGPFSGKTVFAKHVRGIKPRHFVEDSINQTTNRLEEFSIRAIQEVNL